MWLVRSGCIRVRGCLTDVGYSGWGDGRRESDVSDGGGDSFELDASDGGADSLEVVVLSVGNVSFASTDPS